MKLYLLLFSVIIAIHSITGSRILCFLISPSRSHAILSVPICEKLAANGHQVLAVTNYKFFEETPNLKNVIIPAQDFNPELKALMASGSNTFSFKFMKLASRHFRNVTKNTILAPEFQKIMENDSFDFLIMLNLMVNNAQIGLADHFKAPYAIFTPMPNALPIREMVGAPSLPATVSHVFLGYASTMTFIQRIKNFGANLFEYLMTYTVDYFSRQDYELLFPSNKYRSFDEMKKNVSLVLLNTHFSDTGIIRPLLPNEIEVGGIQINGNPPPLTGPLKKFLDESKDGAILWTFGSNVEISTTQPEKIDIMLKVLSKLKERIVLKWEIDDMSRLPANVFAQKWLPQNSILAHPNVKLFIAHGGAGGVGEAKFFGIPILGIPFFADQESNVKKLENEGIGRGLMLSSLTEETFSETLNDMLTNQKYRDNIKKFSDKYKDRIASALDTAVFWVEYALKHHGAPHLNYPGKDLNFFQRHSLDVIGLLAAFLWVLYKIIRISISLCCKKRGKGQEKPKTKQKKKFH
uniref:CSON014874 protein n=1 Tax=Culicoides sonorensis TaxID=179676 RepID=A0A336MPG0_CULSO